jgi:hypothetical protein
VQDVLGAYLAASAVLNEESRAETVALMPLDLRTRASAEEDPARR